MFNENIYIIQWRQLVTELLPLCLRRERMIAWLYALINPLIIYYNTFLRCRNDYIFRASISSSICRLEYMLNYLFYKPGLDRQYHRRIMIETNKSLEGVYLFTTGLNSPVDENKTHFGTLYLKTGQETGSVNVFDFTVKIPQPEIGNYNTDEFNAWLTNNALPDKSYNIIIY